MRPVGWRLYFKGGWGSGADLVDQQVALLRAGGDRVAVAVLTSGNPDRAYGEQTLRGVFARLLRGLRRPARPDADVASHAPDARWDTTRAMPTYIMLSTLTPEGVQTIKNNPQRIREVNKEIEQLGATVKAQWATLGRFDFVNVVEAPDEQTMARVSLELGSRGTVRYETLAAIPIDDFIASL